MMSPLGKSESGVLPLEFDRRLTLQFRDSGVTSDAGPFAYRDPDNTLGLTTSDWPPSEPGLSFRQRRKSLSSAAASGFIRGVPANKVCTEQSNPAPLHCFRI